MGTIIWIIQVVASALCVLLLWQSQFLTSIYTIIVAAVLVLLMIATKGLMKRPIRRVGRFITGMILAIIISAILAAADYYLYQLVSTMRHISDADAETTRVAVYVLEDDPAQSIRDAADYDFGILDQQMREDTDQAIEKINEDVGSEISTIGYENPVDLAQGLLDQDCQAIILNDSFVGMISEVEGYEDFESQIRELTAYEWQTDMEAAEKTEGVFTMFISGIDTRGPISTKSRSDVNILAVVNTNTHQVLLVSTPRDYYVPLSISNGVKDKLTHAGIYGVQVSMDTIGMIYDIGVDYYFRVNFSGFEQVIDALGGVTVMSDYDFSAGGYHFVQGANTLNGEQALAFSRERHAFADGDRQRGRNQMAVITGVISRLQSPAVLQNFTQLMNGLEGSFETNMPYDEISEIVRDQLAGGGAWNVESYSVDGTGAKATTYSMNRELYVMVPDEATVETAKEKIEQIK